MRGRFAAPPAGAHIPPPSPRNDFQERRVSDTQGDVKDVTIIGGGPVGLFAAFYAGLRGVSCRIVDALPQLGGQLMALYPEKYIFDVGGLPRILAKDLAKNMIEQGAQFRSEERRVGKEGRGGC